MARSIELTPEEQHMLTMMVYGEGAQSSPESMQMIARTALKRLSSGRRKEFGGTLGEVLNKGYYAVSQPNQPYNEATAGVFHNPQSQDAWNAAQLAVDTVVKSGDYGKAMFYFTPTEIQKLKAQGPRVFDFNKVVPMGRQEEYQLFGYPESKKASHYGR